MSFQKLLAYQKGFDLAMRVFEISKKFQRKKPIL